MPDSDRPARSRHLDVPAGPGLSFWQIWNMSFGFLGIQFGWGLQLANMSAIYTKLGADPGPHPHSLASRACYGVAHSADHRFDE